jgi:hypothetical protein
MTDKKISELPTITGANLTGTDLIPVVDVSSNATSKVTRDEFFKNIPGNVGIGTSSPAAKLHSSVSSSGASPLAGVNVAGFFEAATSASVQVASGASSPAFLFMGDSADIDATRIAAQDGFTQISASGASDYMRFDTGGFIERMRITSAGNVGIGTSSPTAPLHIVRSGETSANITITNTTGNSNLLLSAANTGFNTLYFGDTDNFQSGFVQYANSADSLTSRSAGDIRWQTGGNTERMRITSLGRVGINTTAPSSELDVDGSIIARTALTSLGTLAVSDAMNYNGASVFFIRSRLNGGTVQIGTETPAGTLYYPISIVGATDYTAFSTSTSEAMRIIANGNVGIGTTNPAQRLEVSGVIRTSSTEPRLSFLDTDSAADEKEWVITGINGPLQIQGINDAGAGGGDVIRLTRVANSVRTISGLRAGATSYELSNFDRSLMFSGGVSTVGTATAHDFVVESNDTERMRVTSIGRVGIGTTNPAQLFSVAGTLGVSEAGQNGQRLLISSSGSGALINQNDNSPLSLQIQGNTAVTISTARNVGIGEINPDYKLDVNGTFGFTPGASVTPVDNGDVVFELTNNTTLTVKAKGSDGVVRSGTILLV